MNVIISLLARKTVEKAVEERQKKLPNNARLDNASSIFSETRLNKKS